MKFASLLNSLKFILIAGMLSFAVANMSGCATGMASLECGVESMNPTVMGALDSFESAALAIKLSNFVLLRAPISEQEVWPEALFGAPSGEALLMMGLSLFASSQGITAAIEIDPKTGWPRPTSSLYLFMKEREQLLNKKINRDDYFYFKSQPQSVYYRELGDRKKPGIVHDYVYRNPLMAYGVVTNNKNEMLQLAEEINLTAKGYSRCDAFLRNAKGNEDASVKQAACKDPALKDEVITAALKEKTEDMAIMEQNYGRLANKVYDASVAGADFTMAALTKIGCAVVNGIRAFPNIQQEFQGVKGVYNAAMLFPRIRMVFNSLTIYKNNLGLQYTVYSTMYQQIKGKYQIKDQDPAQEQKNRAAIRRIEVAEAVLKQLEPKFKLAFAGEPVFFTDHELKQIETVAAMFPAVDEMTRLAALERLP